MRQSLGKGLQSLIPKKEYGSSLPQNIGAVGMEENWTPLARKESIFNVEIDKIRRNPFQPRKDITPESLKDLAESIREHGILQPLVVSKAEEISERGRRVEYELVAGERRWLAAKMVGLPYVPVIVRGTADNQKLALALVENIQRENLNPIETALAFKQLRDEFHLSHEEIAKRVSKSREVVTNFLRILALPKEIQRGIAQGKISEGHGRAILMAKPEARTIVYQDIVAKKLTVRQAEEKARSLAEMKNKKSRGGKPVTNPFFRKFERELFDYLGHRVIIHQRGRAGRMIIEFNGAGELKEIVERILKKK